MVSPSSISPISVSEEFILSKCDYFADVHLWPLRMNLNPEAWLSNFLPEEKEYALYLLNSFIYFAPELVNQLFKTAFSSLSNFVTNFESSNPRAIKNDWESFVQELLITEVTGEVPNRTDSGITFVRKARQHLGVDESRIMANEEILGAILTNPRNVVFVDDFVGSGNQFRETWERLHTIGSITTSFAEQSGNGNNFYYIPLVCTSYGFEQISRDCPQVKLAPAHIISDKYNVFNTDSTKIWPEHLASGAKEFIRTASIRAGIDTNDDNEWMGFHKLGLSLGFEDSIPDATIPLFSWKENGWTPLLTR